MRIIPWRSRHLATLFCSLALTMPALAEVAEGTVLSRDNLDSLLGDTFDGHKMADLIPERMAWLIREHGMRLTLEKRSEIRMDPRFEAATQANRSAVSFDPATRSVKGWEAGIPFPDLDPADPHAGDKAAWNIILGQTYGHTIRFPSARYLFIDGNSGLERNQTIEGVRTYMQGRLDDGPTRTADDEMHRTILVFTYPRDVKGIGTFTIRPNDYAEPEKTWAYIKSVRRTRRLSGGAWMDPIGGGDQLNDDWDGWDAEPPKYKSIRLVGKRWMLAAANTQVQFPTDPGDDTFTTVNVKAPPYFMPDAGFRVQPREVYVFEAIAPDAHPYGKKVVYAEADYPGVYMAEYFDRNDAFWKVYWTGRKPVTAPDGFQSVIPVTAHILDFKRMHGTVWVSNPESNPPGWGRQSVTLQKLEQMGR
ncbi:MAG: DUF1329 domain-containing protein [Rhodocyclaceae bacterium]|nr:DUF1329 domain-containing protein [Rhodocyclaceae bacterium]